MEILIYNGYKQIPIIGKYKRRLTVEEAGKLQSFPNPTRDETKMSKNSFLCDSNDQQAYKQFGNSVNIEVIKNCAKALFACAKEKESITKASKPTTRSSRVAV